MAVQKQENNKGVSKKTTSKIGLVGACSVIIASVIGIGIFFKNGGVFKLNNGNSIGILVSWILSAVIAMFTAFAYIEIASSKKSAGTNLGLGGWAGDFVGYNVGRATKILMPLWKYGLTCLAMAIFTGMAIFNIFFCGQVKGEEGYGEWFGSNTMLYSTLLGFGLIAIFMIINYFSDKFGNKFSQIATIMKFVPILIMIVVGMGWGIKNGGGLWTGDYSHITGVDQEQKGQFNILGMLNSIPAIMFAFDGFLIVGNIAAKVENPRKNVSRSIVIAMIIIIILNLAITVSCITIGCGDPFLAFGQAFGEGTILAAVFTYTMAALIAFSAVACVNAFTMAGVDSLQDCIKDESIMFANYFKRIRTSDDCKLAATLYYSAFLAIVGIALSIPSCILNTDQIWDGTTVVSVIIFFALYGIVICGGLMNRKTYRCEVAMKSKMFVPSGVIGAIGCLFIAGYSLFYTYLGNMFIGSHATDTFQAWGLSFTPDAVTGNYFQGYVAAIIFWVLFVVICLYPFLNDLGIMLTNKDYGHALMWQREDAQPVIIINQEAPKLPPLALSKKGKKKTVA